MSFKILKMLVPSPPALPAVPSLAELQKHAETLTASLPSYSSFSTSPAPPLVESNKKSPQTDMVKSKPIPRVIIHPSGHTNDKPEEGDKSWLSGIGLSLGSWSSTPPPSYKAEPIALTHKQLRVEMRADNRTERQEVDQGRQVLAKMHQESCRLGGQREVQGKIPGEEGGRVKERVIRRDRWGREVGKNIE